MMIALYASKKDLKAQVGQPLKYKETSAFGNEYKNDGTFSVCNRPSIIKYVGPAREFFAQVTMAGGLISKVS